MQTIHIKCPFLGPQKGDTSRCLYDLSLPKIPTSKSNPTAEKETQLLMMPIVESNATGYTMHASKTCMQQAKIKLAKIPRAFSVSPHWV